MKTIGIILCMFAFSLNGIAQDEPELSKKDLKAIAKEEKKAQQAEEQEQKRIATEYMLNSHKFVLEADYLSSGSQRIPVSSNLNFIIVDSTNITIQLGSASGGLGNNGVGGITADGNITSYKFDLIEGKKSKNYNLMIIMMSPIGIFDISLFINEIGYTNATIRANTSGNFSYSGNLVPIPLSNVYKGNTRY